MRTENHPTSTMLFGLVISTIATVLMGCKPTSQNAIDKSGVRSGLTKVTLILNWYPEAEHGGFYAAKVHGIYQQHGLDVDIRPGGMSVMVPQELQIGRAQFGVANADDVLMAREQQLPIVALMAPMQNGPRCIMVREDSGITSFEGLKNLTLQINSARPYVPFLKSKGLIGENVQIVPYSGGVTQLVAGAGIAQQAYNFSEPLLAEQQRVKVRCLMMSDIGYNPYASLLIASEKYIADHEDVVGRMVQASIEGWKQYLAEPAQTNAYILSQDKERMSPEALAYGVEKLKPLCLPEGFDISRLGEMTAERWQELTTVLQELRVQDGSIVSKRIHAKDAFTDRFLMAVAK